jgi:hypothetical protein
MGQLPSLLLVDESESLTVLRAFEDVNLVLWDMTNQWLNCLDLGLL